MIPNFATTIDVYSGGHGNEHSRKGSVTAQHTVLDDKFTEDILKKMSRCNNKGYAVNGALGKLEYLHIKIYEYYHGPVPEGMTVDHRDQDPTNNIPDNLRAAIQTVQNANMGIKASNTSGFKCVQHDSYDAVIKGRHYHYDKWMARVIRHGKESVRRFPFTEAGWREAARTVNELYKKIYPEVSVIPCPDWDTKPYPF